jgi:O-antigen/teichoic acid export membrane protein
VIFSILADFGINNTVIREVARNKNKSSRFISNGLILKIFLSVLTLLAIWIATFFLHKGVEVNIFVYLLGLYVIFNSYNTFFKSIYRAYEKMQYEAFLKIIEAFLLIFYLCLTSFYFKDVYLTVLGFAIISFITLFLSIFWINKYFSRFNFIVDTKIIKFILRESWPFALAGIFVTIYFNIDTVMVSLIKGDIETGLYSASYNFIFATSMLSSLTSSALYPYLSRIHNTSKKIKNINKYIRTFFFSGVLLSLGLFFCADILIKLFYGSDYINATGSLKILSLILPFSFACTFIGTYFASINKQITGMFVACVGAILNIILNYFLINSYGQLGAALASLASFVTMFILWLVFYRFYLNK